MNRLSFFLLTAVITATLASCSSNDRFEVGGVPEWIGSGAKLSDEPEPLSPDNRYIQERDASGPVKFTYITDDHNYPDTPERKKIKTDLDDPLERGRENRIKRLVR